VYPSELLDFGRRPARLGASHAAEEELLGIHRKIVGGAKCVAALMTFSVMLLFDFTSRALGDDDRAECQHRIRKAEENWILPSTNTVNTAHRRMLDTLNSRPSVNAATIVFVPVERARAQMA